VDNILANRVNVNVIRDLTVKRARGVGLHRPFECIIIILLHFTAACPGACSGHGVCLTTNELYDYYTLNKTNPWYIGWDANATTSCACEMGKQLFSHSFIFIKMLLPNDTYDRLYGRRM
jgi:hypothetical protein